MPARVGAATTTALGLSTVALLPPVHDVRAGIVSRPSVIAHRGASAQAPENTLDAVDEAASPASAGWRTTSSAPGTAGSW